MKNPAKCRVFGGIVQNTYRQRPQWQSHSCSERTVVTIAVVCFISVLYMMIGEKSRLFGLVASRIFAGRNTLAITVWAVSKPDQINRHESYHFIFTGFFPIVTFDSMYHRCLLDIHIQRLSLQKGLHSQENRLRRAYCYFWLQGITTSLVGCSRSHQEFFIVCR